MTRQYASAGAVVVTTDITSPRTLLLDQTRTTGQQQSVAPKGRIEPGEAPLAAAIREVTEEAGLAGLAYAGYLGQETYRFTDNDATPATKTVDWYLLATHSSTTNIRQAEGFTRARWLPLNQATRAASHPSFHTHLNRAADLITWRRTAGLPFSTALDHVVRAVAEQAQPLLHGHTGAGVAVCGSAARGDYVPGWSDIDLIGYGLPAGSPTIQALTALVADIADRHGVRVSLHLADNNGRRLPDAGALYDRKLQTTLRRIGTDTAVIAGTPPTTVPPAPNDAETLNGLAALRRFAAERLTAPATDRPPRTLRRTPPAAVL